MRRLVGVSAAALAALALVGGPVASYAGDATAYVVHGIPNVPVDVAVDGACAIENFMFGGQVGPIGLSPGNHTIRISLANPMDPCTGTVVLEAPIPFMADENVTLIAYLNGMGAPTASKFENDFSRPDPGTARVIAHHCAAAPAADISVNRDMDEPFKPKVESLSNGEQVVEQFRPGEWYVSLAQAGTTDPVIGPVCVKLHPFTVHRLYAVGSALDGTLTVLHFEYDAK
ncbi:MAG: DUF4397 domain-containing protein [Armatimonadetes bacterium]|nr:DUF4397 domain-containing protein [Armatimonadota bacterium]